MKYLFVILFSFALLTSCTNTSPVVQSACEVTDQICKYAQLICNNLPGTGITDSQQSFYLEKLNIINANLKAASDKQEKTKLNKSLGNPDEYDDELLQARNSLKKLADDLQSQ